MNKNRKKYLLMSIIAFIVLLIAINFSKIKFTASMIVDFINSDSNMEASIDSVSEVGEADNPLLDIIDVSQQKKESNNKPSGKEGKNNDSNNSNTSSSENEVSKSENKKEKETSVEKSQYVEIISKYNSEFEMMRNDFEAKLDSLVQVGYKEYSSGNISTSKLASKYINEGTGLEGEADRNFNILLNKLKEELDSNGHSTDITKDLKSYYRNYKSSVKAQYMNKVKNHL